MYDPALLYNISDKVSAYQKQFVFSNNPAMYNVTLSYVMAYSPADNGNLPGGHLNTYTSYFNLMYHRGAYIVGISLLTCHIRVFLSHISITNEKSRVYYYYTYYF